MTTMQGLPRRMSNAKFSTLCIGYRRVNIGKAAEFITATSQASRTFYRLRGRNADDFRVDGGCVIDPLQNSHRRVGKLSLRKNHHAIEWDSRQRLESAHSLQSLFGLPCETVGPLNTKLASCVVASVDGKRISGRVVLEKPYNLRYTPPPIPWNECNACGKVVRPHGGK